MNIIKRDNQRAVIHLSKIRGTEMFFARAIVFTLTFNGTYTSHLIGIKKMSAAEAEELRSQTEILSQYNITLVDADASAAEIVVATALLGVISKTATESTEKPAVSIPSPYASKIGILEAFFSTQKTRAPTR